MSTCNHLLYFAGFVQSQAPKWQTKMHMYNQGGGREMEINLNKLSEIERSDWSKATSSKRDVAYGVAPKRLLF